MSRADGVSGSIFSADGRRDLRRVETERLFDDRPNRRGDRVRDQRAPSARMRASFASRVGFGPQSAQFRVVEVVV